jgi:hypothetical protein
MSRPVLDDMSRDHTVLPVLLSKQAARPWNAAAQTMLPLIAGELVTSATRSSSVAPLGRATVTSHTAAPLLLAIATSLPPGNPASVTLPTGSTPHVGTQRQGRSTALIHPAPLAVGGIESEDPRIAGADDRETIGHRRRRQHLRTHPRLPCLATGGRFEGQHFALGCADHHQLAVAADAARKRLAGADAPDLAATVEARNWCRHGRPRRHCRLPPRAKT